MRPTTDRENRALHRQLGFSLVELLVVIGIVAVLLAILLPSLRAARESAERAKCLVTLKNLHLAATLHAAAHGGYYPIAGQHWDPTNGVCDPAGLDDPRERRYTYYTDSSERRPMPLCGVLAQQLGAQVRADSRDNLAADLRSESVQRYVTCPSQTVIEPGLTQLAADDTWRGPPEYCGYIYNEAILGRRGQAPARIIHGNVGRVRRTSVVFFAADGRPRSPTADNYFLVFDFGDDDTLGTFWKRAQSADIGKEFLDFNRHRRRINVVFLDGHAESIPMTDNGLDEIGISRGVFQ